MQIKAMTVNAAGMAAAGWSVKEKGNQIQSGGSLFGPECRVTISQEGRNLSEGQSDQAGISVRKEKMLLHQLEEAEQAQKTREGYYDELNELEKQIKAFNAAYGVMKENMAYDDPLMKEVVKQQQLLQEEMQEQKDFQREEGEKRLREAQQLAAMQASQYQEEIDKNNRDLVALLKSIEEAEKAENGQENGGLQDDGSTSDTGNSSSDAIHSAAAGFVQSSLNHEKGVEELAGMIGDSGREFLSKANDVTQNLLKKSASIKKAVEDKSFTAVQLEEMMQSFRREVEAESEKAYIYGSFGTQVLRDMQDVKTQRITDDPLQSMQVTKDGMMQAAMAAALSEARHSSLDKTSGRLADEVEELIDKRNHVDRIPQDEREDKEKQREIAKRQEESAV